MCLGVKICSVVFCSFYQTTAPAVKLPASVVTINSFEGRLCMWGNFKFKVKWVAFVLNTRKASCSQKQREKINSLSFLITGAPNINSITQAHFTFLCQTFLCCIVEQYHQHTNCSIIYTHSLSCFLYFHLLLYTKFNSVIQ